MAHPDDETLWAGGALLLHPAWSTVVVSVCRGSDPDRAPRFFRALDALGARGALGDLDDGPSQEPLGDEEVERCLLSLLTEPRFDLVLTHGPCGEYTRHRRHEEVSAAVLRLWQSGRLQTPWLCMFAFDDGRGTRLPSARPDAPERVDLEPRVWAEKRRIITEIYGFGPDSFEARTTPHSEACWCFDAPTVAADRAETMLAAVPSHAGAALQEDPKR